jgi:hypothetical protein
MGHCEVCGNEYDKVFSVILNGKSHWFDSFECAIHALAPTCGQCGCRIVGHGVEHEGHYYCCVHCARLEGVAGLEDRN